LFAGKAKDGDLRMAMIIRDENKLLALQLQLLALPGGETLSCALFNGPEPIGGAMTLPARAFGLPDGDDEHAFASARLRLPEALIAPLRAASARLVAPDAPLWLFIPRGAGKLALFPWESEIERALDRPLLHLPNFLDDPFEAGMTLEIALAVSLPAECDVAPAANLVAAFFTALTGPMPPHRDIVVHIFADAACEDLVARLSPPPGLGSPRIEIHPASTAQVTPPASAGEVATRRFVSPWLGWMARRLKGKAIDLVHFICPSYYTDTCSCLALQQTGLERSDPLWRRLVATEEMCALLDELGVKAVSFTAAGYGCYERAASRVAFDVSWRRPGPVIAVPAEPRPERLAAALGLICADADVQVRHLGGTVFNCHPRHLIGAEARAAQDGPMRESMPSPSPDIDRTLRIVAKAPGGGGTAEPPLEALPPDEPRYRSLWTQIGPVTSTQERLVDRYLRKSRASLDPADATSRIRRLEQKGAARALDLVDKLLAKAARSGGADKAGD
jgi:hypothetical protein